MANEIVEQEQIKYSYGNVIHNQLVINELRNKGLITVNDITEIPESASVLVRAHGVSKTFYEETQKRNLKIYDATCPYVRNIQKKVEDMHLQ